MSDDIFNTSRGQHHSANITSEEHEANDSLIQKVKSKVSSILPQKLSQWFSPTTSSEENRNGNFRRRRIEEDNLSDSDPDGSYNDKNAVSVPPSKKSRPNYEEPNQTLFLKKSSNAVGQVSNKFFSSTPMLDIRGRKELHSYNNYTKPHFSSPQTKVYNSQMVDIDEEPDIIEVVPKLEETKSNLNASTSNRITSDRFKRANHFGGSFMSPSNILEKSNAKVSQQDTEEVEEEYGEEIDEDDDEDDDELAEEDDDDDEINTSGTSKHPILEKRNKIGNGISNTPNVVIRQSENQESSSESGESQYSSTIGRTVQEQEHRKGVRENYDHVGLKSTKNSLFQQTKANSNSFTFYSHLEGKKSLFSSKNMSSVFNNSTMSLTSLNRRQQFNSSLYGSTSALSDSRLLNTSSPFYKGRTTYGGASAYGNFMSSSSVRQMRVTPTLIRPSSSLSNISNSSQEAANIMNCSKYLDNSSANTGVSNTAKRILELMDNFTTPLNEAKKLADSLKTSQTISNKRRFTEGDYLADKYTNIGMRLQKPKTPYSRPYETINTRNTQNASDSSLLPPVNPLQVPSMAQLLQLKTLQANTVRNRELAASNEKSLLNQKTDYKIPSAASASDEKNQEHKFTSGHGGKIRNKINSTRSSTKALYDMEMPETPNLPDIQFPAMKAIPKIDISIKQTTSNTTTVTKAPETDSLNNIAKPQSQVDVTNATFKLPISSISSSPKASVLSNSNLNNLNSNFKFSTPISVGIDIDPKNISISMVNNFKFSHPVPVEVYEKEENNTVPNKHEKLNDICFKNPNINEASIQSSSVTKNVISNAITNQTNKPSPQLNTGSVINALKNPTTASNLEQNNISKENISKSTIVSSINSGFGDAFKKPSNQWECSVCMIRNDETREKCLACETPRKSKKSEGNSSSTASKSVLTSYGLSDNLKEKFRPDPTTWECKTCLIRNKKENSKCVACDTPKIGGDKIDSESKTTCNEVSNKSNTLAKKSEDSKIIDKDFKEIVAQQNSKWECSACLTRNDPNRSKCICCEQAKPGSTSVNSSASFSFGAAASKFSFGFSNSKQSEISENKKTDEKSDSNMSGANLAPQASNTFKFGIPSNTSTLTTAGTFTINSPSTFTFGTLKQSNEKQTEPDPKTSQTESLKSVSAPTFSFGLNKSTASNNKLESATGSAASNTISTTNTIKSNIFGNSLCEGNENAKEINNKSDQNQGIVFGSPTANTDVPDTKSKSFSFGQTTTATSVNNFTKAVVTSTPTGFTFGSTSIANQNTANSTNVTSSATGFSFGTIPVSTTITTSASSVSTTNATSTVTTSTLPTTPFLFGSNKLNTSKSSFGTPSTLTNTSTSLLNTTITSTAAISTSSMPAVTTTWTNVFGSPSSLNQVNNSTLNNEGASNPIGSTFGILANKKSEPTVPVFQFGGNTTANKNVDESDKKAELTPAPIFGSPSSTLGTTTSNNKTFNFGSPATTAMFGSGSNTFVFGASKISNDVNNSTQPTLPAAPINNNSIFGSTPNNTNTFGSTNSAFGSGSAFGSTQQTGSGSPFGQPSSLPNTNLFSNSAQQTKPSTSFGTPSQASTNLFGTSNTNEAASPFNATSSTNAGTFGIASGTSASPSFGSASSLTPSFGSPNPTVAFGSTSTNNNSVFNMPIQQQQPDMTKKADVLFNFGAPAASTGPIGGGFSFGSNNNATKPAFNFTANTQPSFNFTGSTETTANAPFTFNATTPTTNIFAPTPTPGGQSTSQTRRKIRSATRRTQPR